MKPDKRKFYVHVTVANITYVRFTRTQDEAAIMAASMYDTFKTTPHIKEAA